MIRRLRAVAKPAGRLVIGDGSPNLAERPCRPITVLSANLWHDWPRYRLRQERLEAFGRLVESEAVDVALLQEVARTPALRADEWLADRLGMGYVYSRANGHEGAIGFEEGLAVFSRFGLYRPRLQQLGSSFNPFVRRLALGAEVETPCGTLLAFSAHLGLLRRQNSVQLGHLQDWVGAVAGEHTALIGGDFNAHESTARIAHVRRTWLDTFRHLHPEADGATHELRWPWGGLIRRHRLDYVFLHPGWQRWKVLEARHLIAPGGRHSDHLAVLVRLALESG